MSISSISSTQSQSVSGLVALQQTHHKKELNESTAPPIAATSFSTTYANQLGSAIAATLAQLGLTSALGTASTAAIKPADALSRSADTTSTPPDPLSTINALKSLQAFTAQLMAAAQQTADTDAASTSNGGNSVWAAAVASATEASSTTTTAAAPAATGSVNTVATSNAPLAPLPQQLKGSQQVQQYRNIASTFSNLAQALSSSSSSTSSTSSGASSLTTVFQNLWTSLSASSGISVDSSSNKVPSLPSFLQTLARNFSESGISGLHGMFVDTVV
jgi:hypothetical protein